MQLIEPKNDPQEVLRTILEYHSGYFSVVEFSFISRKFNRASHHLVKLYFDQDANISSGQDAFFFFVGWMIWLFFFAPSS